MPCLEVRRSSPRKSRRAYQSRRALLLPQTCVPDIPDALRAALTPVQRSAAVSRAAVRSRYVSALTFATRFRKGATQIPRGVSVHHEVELGVVIGRRATSVPSSEAFSYVKGYCLAIDLTARNMQDVVKKAGLPWTAVKGFDTCATPFTNVKREAGIQRAASARSLNLYRLAKCRMRMSSCSTSRSAPLALPQLTLTCPLRLTAR